MTRRVVQIHPTLRCNLTCAHCYSASSPQMPAGLDPEDILRATGTLAARGYDHASLSGGEPTIYHGLDRLCDGLRAQGYLISLITNGLQPARVADFAARHAPAIVSVSFDGLAPRHDLIRRRQGSFDRALQSLSRLAYEGQRCGAVVSFSDDGFADLPDLVAQVVAAGANHVQLHPVSELGRGAAGTLVREPSDETMLRGMVLAQVLNAVHASAEIVCDALTGPMLAARPRPAIGDPVSPVVIGADGAVFPIAYGLRDSFGFGRVDGPLREPVYDAALAALVDRCWSAASRRAATAFYPDLARLSHAGEMV